jgi:hypothetical protein
MYQFLRRKKGCLRHKKALFKLKKKLSKTTRKSSSTQRKAHKPATMSLLKTNKKQKKTPPQRYGYGGVS